jgi:glycosyltransferase involved in cell wall biosynthesis
VESILEQTFQDWELILVNDGSRDNSLAICNEYAMRDSRIQVVSQKNEGPASARNSGMNYAKGEYLVFCDADDNFTNEQVVSALNKNAAEGLSILSAGPIVMKTSELSFAEYSLTIKDLDVEYLKNFEKFLNGNVIIATKKGKKGKVTELNLAEQVKSINTELNDNVLNINVVLPAGNTGNINPVLFIEAFCDIGNRKPEVCHINRNMLFNASMEKFV